MSRWKPSIGEIEFSDSLIINKEKTKEITTVVVDWILDLSIEFCKLLL